MKSRISLLLIVLVTVSNSFSQVISDTLKNKIVRISMDDSTNLTNQDAIYNRPFIGMQRRSSAIGGYLEGNTNCFSEDCFSMEFRRFNFFSIQRSGLE